MSKPPSDCIFLLVKYGELVLTLRENNVNSNLILIDELCFNARVIVKTSKRVVNEFLTPLAIIYSLENCFELCRCCKIIPNCHIKKVSD